MALAQAPGSRFNLRAAADSRSFISAEINREKGKGEDEHFVKKRRRNLTRIYDWSEEVEHGQRETDAESGVRGRARAQTWTTGLRWCSEHCFCKWCWFKYPLTLFHHYKWVIYSNTVSPEAQAAFTFSTSQMCRSDALKSLYQMYSCIIPNVKRITCFCKESWHISILGWNYVILSKSKHVSFHFNHLFVYISS